MDTLKNIPIWVWTWLLTVIVGFLAGKAQLKKFLFFLNAVDEFIDIPQKIIKAYMDDKKFSASEIKEIQREINEFQDTLRLLRGE